MIIRAGQSRRDLERGVRAVDDARRHMEAAMREEVRRHATNVDQIHRVYEGVALAVQVILTDGLASGEKDRKKRAEAVVKARGQVDAFLSLVERAEREERGAQEAAKREEAQLRAKESMDKVAGTEITEKAIAS